MAGSAWRPNTEEEKAFRGCIGKARYSTMEFAEHVKAGCIEARPWARLRIYECTVCNGWHLTSFSRPAARCGSCLEIFNPFNPADWQCDACRHR